jgi:hypothetical protein
LVPLGREERLLFSAVMFFSIVVSMTPYHY